MTLVSVVIPTKHRPTAVCDTVASIFASTYQQFEVFVVDQSPDDTTRDMLARFADDSRFTYVTNRAGRPGASSSRNIGIALSAGDIVAHIDDDVTVRPNWMERLVAEFEADPALQFLAGKLAAPQHDTTAGFIPASDPQAEVPPVNQWTLSILTAGANYAMRRSLFDRVGGYDECFGPGTAFPGGDDASMALRISRSGAKWKASSAVEVVHTHGFRPLADAAALLRGYSRGNGGNFGRATRQGDLWAGLWFLGWQSREAIGIVLPNLLLGRRPTHLRAVCDCVAGFWHGFWLPPDEGSISGADLRRLRQELLHSTALDAKALQR